jgi:hypothetical protein
MIMSNLLASVPDLFRLQMDLNRARAAARYERLLRQRRREAELGAQTDAFTKLKLESGLKDRSGDATRDTFTWVTQFAKTWNEHWIEEGRPEPYEPFPAYPYFQDVFDLIDSERVTWFEKSRDLMLSWACVAYLTRQAMTTPYRGVLFQCQKEDKVIQLVEYAKCLYKTQPEWLQQAYPLKKALDKQPELELQFANGSYIAGIPGGSDQIRSYHPWGYLNDESSFQPEAGDCFNEALSVVKGKIIFNSSAGPGWFADARHDVIRNEED